MTKISGISTSERRRKLFLAVEHLRGLPEGWDGPGSKPPCEQVLSKAIDLALAIIPKENEFYLVPCGEDAVQIEWHRDGFDVEIFVQLAGAS